jgi:hypothetical protein
VNEYVANYRRWERFEYLPKPLTNLLERMCLCSP